MLNEINLFDDKNKELRKYFFFFFCVAICGYLSLIVSSRPYNDDFCRYVVNTNVGTLAAQRYITFFIETFAYLSNVITDAAPFTQILSCAFLAYSAVICLKIFNVDLKSKLEVLCFVPVIINPYMLEIMMFRFDNPFSTLALFFVIIAAYLSAQNNRKFLFTQTALLFLTLFMYQTASSAYFIICAYIFIREIHLGKSLEETVIKMRYWLCTLFIVAICYIPFTYSLEYCVAKNEGSAAALPTNLQNISIIIDNVVRYFSNLYIDWSKNIVGQIFFALFVIFVLRIILQTFTKTKSVISTLSSIIGIFAFTLAPFGTCILVKVMSYEGNESVLPRAIYSMGILISLVLYSNCNLFKISKRTTNFYGFVVVILCIWNAVFLNSASNIINVFRDLQSHVFYDVAKDIYAITHDQNEGKDISCVCINGSIWSQAMDKFFKLYPIMDRIIPEKWNIPEYCQIALMNYNFAQRFLKYIPVRKKFVKEKYSEKKLVKNSALYDLYILDNKMILISFKHDIKYKYKKITFLGIGDGYWNE